MKANKIISVAIADDSPYIRKGLLFTLNTYKDIAIDIVAEDGIDLLDKIESSRKLPDVCLLDISMPRMDGYEALKRIKTIWPQMKVIMMSIHYNEFAIIRTFRDGASGFLPKEATPEELHTAITQSHETGLYHTEPTSQHMSLALQNKSIITDLTDKELDFLRFACLDLNYKQIAELMKVKPRTVDSYRDSLFAKLKVSSRAALVVFAIRTGIVPTIAEKK
jgi:two-component system, NarL family, invasion response regulator UvrY